MRLLAEVILFTFSSFFNITILLSTFAILFFITAEERQIHFTEELE